MAGIYLHIPFCKSKCNYCDFYSKINLSNIDILVKSEIAELVYRHQYIGSELVNSIYFGGGTPSLLSIHHIYDILNTIRLNYTVSVDCEITFEANPEDLNEEYLYLLFQSGVNRLSVGIQSFNDDILNYLGRRHSSSNLANIISIAKKVGFSNISVDLIFGIPGFQQKDYFKSLNFFKALDVQHISAYALTIEKKTYFHKLMRKNLFSEILENEIIEQFNYTIDFFESISFKHYEISNFCKEGYISKHNSSYWSNSNYLGIGPSAHSFNGFSRQWNVSSIKKYCINVSDDGRYFSIEYLTDIDKYNEYILTGLRTSNGINSTTILEHFGEVYFNYFVGMLNQLINDQLITKLDDSILLTRKGILVSDFVIRQFFYS